MFLNAGWELFENVYILEAHNMPTFFDSLIIPESVYIMGQIGHKIGHMLACYVSPAQQRKSL